MTHLTDEELDALLTRMERITGHKYASRDQCLLNCELGTIGLGDVADLCTAITSMRADLAKAMEALKFYADWEMEEMEPPSKEEAEAYDFILNFPTPKALFDEGEKARAAMASIGKATQG